MIYRDAEVQVMIDHERSMLSNGSGEATLIINLGVNPNEDTENAIRSLKRRQRFDCRNGTQAIVDEEVFTRPVARGEALTYSRTPNATMQSPQDGSIDAKILSALCVASL
ncbi:hypothetical protein GCM10027266_15840 [Arenimonas alkanexedens]